MHKIITMLVVVFIAASLFVGCSHEERDRLTARVASLEADSIQTASKIVVFRDTLNTRQFTIYQRDITIDSLTKANATSQAEAASWRSKAKKLEAQNAGLTVERDSLVCIAEEYVACQAQLKKLENDFADAKLIIIQQSGQIAAAKTHADSTEILLNYHYLKGERWCIPVFHGRTPKHPGFTAQDIGIVIHDRKTYELLLKR